MTVSLVSGVKWPPAAVIGGFSDAVCSMKQVLEQLTPGDRVPYTGLQRPGSGPWLHTQRWLRDWARGPKADGDKGGRQFITESKGSRGHV